MARVSDGSFSLQKILRGFPGILKCAGMGAQAVTTTAKRMEWTSAEQQQTETCPKSCLEVRDSDLAFLKVYLSLSEGESGFYFP